MSDPKKKEKDEVENDGDPPEDVVPNEPKVVIDTRLLKPGEYQIHVFIEESRGLDTEKESTIDPMIKIMAFDQTKHSSAKKDRGSSMIFWGEHFFFDKKFESSSSFEVQKLKVQMMDHNAVLANSLIGEFEMDLVSIFFSDKHAIQYQWAALSNLSTNDFQNIKGYVKFSVSVVGPGDEQIALEPEPFKQDDKAVAGRPGGKVLLPPQIQTKGYQFIIKLLRAEALVKMDLTGKTDLYIIIEFGSARYKTKTKKSTLTPVWGYEVYIPYSQPTLNDQLTMKFYDWDRGTKDEIIGSYSFSRKEIEGKTESGRRLDKPFWTNIYGAQKDAKDKNMANIMNGNPALGSFFKGRILLSLESKQCDNPILSDREKQKLLDPNFTLNYMDSPKKIKMQWVFRAEIHYGLNFPKNANYIIEVQWGENIRATHDVTGRNGVWEFYESIGMVCSFPYEQKFELPDLFIYLKKGSDLIAYIRKDSTYCMNQLVTENASLYFFKPDKSKCPEMKDFEAGMIKMRFTVGPEDQLSDLKCGKWDRNISSWKEKVAKYKHGYLMANVYHAQDLIPADEDGNSDPFFTFSYYGHEEQSEIINGSLNPVWYSRQCLTIPFFPIEEAPPIIFNMYDADDKKGINRDYLGGAIINIADGIKEGWIVYDTMKIPEPKFLDLYLNSDTKSGRVLISFNYTSFKEGAEVPSITPEMESYELKIKVLGLRNLKSLGLLPVKRPFIKFDINGMKPKELKQALAEKKSIQTQPKETGSDPNISTIINCKIDLPKNYLYCPSLNCVVFDCIYKGFIQPSLGVFSINISEFIKAGRDKNSKKLKAFANVASKQLGLFKTPAIAPVGINVAKGPLIPTFGRLNDKNVEEAKLVKQINSISVPNDNEEDLKTKLLISPKKENVAIPIPNEGRNESEYRSPIEHREITLEVEMGKVQPPQNPELTQEQFEKIPDVIKPTGGIRSEFIVVKAKYSWDDNEKTAREFESDVPDPNCFFPLGWDQKESRLKMINGNPSSDENCRKHYRYLVRKPLEQSVFVDKHTFDEFTIRRGKRVAEDTLFSKLLGKTQKEKEVGKFKGWVEITSIKEREALEKNKFAKMAFSSKKSVSSRSVSSKRNKNFNIDEEFMTKTDVIVRAYILRAESLYSMDNDPDAKEALSDPYLKLKLGDQVFDNEKEYQENKTECDFYKMFEFKAVLPGASQLQIQVWDHDALVKDDLIGETFIDLENRFFSRRWRKLDNIPVEVRPLYVPTSSLERGRLFMFIEIIPVKERLEIENIWFIQPKPAAEYELRVVVWDIEDVPSHDVEDCSDLFVVGIFQDKQQKTDTHFRAQGGAGSFNWRMVWPISIPEKITNEMTLTFQIWDKDYFSPSDFISDATFGFQSEAKKAFDTNNPIKILSNNDRLKSSASAGLNKAIDGIGNGLTGKKDPSEGKQLVKPDEKFVISLTNSQKDKDKYKFLKEEGRMTLSFELVPKSIADVNKVGLGRAEPNHSPWLPPPVGRFEWSWNPITLFKRCVGPKARTKICMCLCVLICTALLIQLAPVIIGSIISKGIAAI